MLQKIIAVGNSLAITLPASFIRNAGWKAGDEIMVEHNANKQIAVVMPKIHSGTKHLTPEFYEWLDENATKYKSAIKELANINDNRLS